MKQPGDKWDRQGVDIVEACECPDYPEDDPDKFREDCDTDREFLQEYMRKFFDAEGNYFSSLELKQLPACPDHHTDAEVSAYLGCDIGRKNDLTAICESREWSYDGKDHLWVPRLWLMDGVKFKHQRKAIKLLIEGVDPDGACLDETAHPSLVEAVVDYFDIGDTTFSGEDVKGLTGDRERKKDNTQRIQKFIENDAFYHTPTTVYEWSGTGFVESERDEVLLGDLCKVVEQTTANGNIKYEAPRDDEGHADSYSAFLLALAAREETKSSYLGSY